MRSDRDVLADVPKVGGLLKLRRMGSQAVHLADVNTDELIETKWIGPAYWAVHQATAAICGAVLRPDHRGLVVMEDRTTITCRHCRRAAQRDGSACGQ